MLHMGTAEWDAEWSAEAVAEDVILSVRSGSAMGWASLAVNFALPKVCGGHSGYMEEPVLSTHTHAHVHYY